MRRTNLLAAGFLALITALGIWVVTVGAETGRKWYGRGTPGGHEEYASVEQNVGANQTNVQINFPWAAERAVVRADQQITVRFSSQNNDSVTIPANGFMDTDYLFVNFSRVFVTTGGSATNVRIVAAKQEE